jgi:hypothetical protein
VRRSHSPDQIFREAISDYLSIEACKGFASDQNHPTGQDNLKVLNTLSGSTLANLMQIGHFKGNF